MQMNISFLKQIALSEHYSLMTVYKSYNENVQIERLKHPISVLVMHTDPRGVGTSLNIR